MIVANVEKTRLVIGDKKSSKAAFQSAVRNADELRRKVSGGLDQVGHRSTKTIHRHVIP